MSETTQVVPKPGQVLKAFQDVESEFDNLCHTVGEILLVQVFDMQPVSSGGIEIVQSVKQTNTMTAGAPLWCRVLKAGEGFYREDENGNPVSEPLSTKPGEIVVVGPNSVNEFTVYGELTTTNRQIRLGYTRENEIIEKFPDQQSYERYFEELLRKIDHE